MVLLMGQPKCFHCPSNKVGVLIAVVMITRTLNVVQFGKELEMNRSKRTSLLMMLAVLVAIIQCGCGSERQAKTGFLSDYSRMKVVEDGRYEYISPQFGRYLKYIIDPVILHLPAEDKRKASPKDMQDMANLQQYMHTEFHNAMLQGYDVVTSPGPGVARIRLSITDLDKSKTAMNIIPQTKLAGVGLGGAAMEGEIIDSMTGEQLAAVLQSMKGKRLSLDGLSKWGDAKAVIREWAHTFKGRIDQHHGR